MRVLLCGAKGFIGQHIARALVNAGHQVLNGTSSVQADGIAMNFSTDIDAAVWVKRLQSLQLDAVVNAVGVLRSTQGRPMHVVHTDAPRALFDACADLGIKKVIQVSALGIETSATVYASSKREADQHLLALTQAGKLDGYVLRPSIVLGRGGASTELFLKLAGLPFCLLPQQAGSTKVQPIAAIDLAEVVTRLVSQGASVSPRCVPCVGPRAMTLIELLQSLRMARGKPAATYRMLPTWLVRFSARMGDCFPVTPWGTQTLDLLSHDNTASTKDVQQILQRLPAGIESLQ